MSVCHGVPSNCFFFFVSRWNRAIFGRQFSMWHSTKLFLRFLILGPLNPKIYSSKFCTKSPISRLVWQMDRQCLGLLGGFRRWPIQLNHAKCCGAAGVGLMGSPKNALLKTGQLIKLLVINHLVYEIVLAVGPIG